MNILSTWQLLAMPFVVMICQLNSWAQHKSHTLSPQATRHKKSDVLKYVFLFKNYSGHFLQKEIHQKYPLSTKFLYIFQIIILMQTKR